MPEDVVVEEVSLSTDERPLWRLRSIWCFATALEALMAAYVLPELNFFSYGFMQSRGVLLATPYALDAMPFGMALFALTRRAALRVARREIPLALDVIVAALVCHVCHRRGIIGDLDPRRDVAMCLCVGTLLVAIVRAFDLVHSEPRTRNHVVLGLCAVIGLFLVVRLRSSVEVFAFVMGEPIASRASVRALVLLVVLVLALGARVRLRERLDSIEERCVIAVAIALVCLVLMAWSSLVMVDTYAAVTGGPIIACLVPASGLCVLLLLATTVSDRTSGARMLGTVFGAWFLATSALALTDHFAPRPDPRSVRYAPATALRADPTRMLIWDPSGHPTWHRRAPFEHADVVLEVGPRALSHDACKTPAVTERLGDYRVLHPNDRVLTRATLVLHRDARDRDLARCVEELEFAEIRVVDMLGRVTSSPLDWTPLRTFVHRAAPYAVALRAPVSSLRCNADIATRCAASGIIRVQTLVHETAPPR